MKKIFKVYLLLTLVITIISCKEQKGTTVGLLMESFGAARWEIDRKYFEQSVKELGGNVITKMSDGTDATQYAQAIELIEQGVDVIVIVAANVNSAAAIVREAHHENIKVIAYDRLIKNSELDYFVGLNVAQIGEFQARYALERKPQGNYVIIGGDKSDDNAIVLMNGQKEILKEKVGKGDINILYKGYTSGWSAKEAAYEVEQVIKLSGKNIDAVITSNDGMAGGVIEALNKYDIQNAIVTGLDAELAACRRINKGEQSMTVYQPYKKIATAAAELAVKVAKKDKLDYSFSYRDNGRIKVPSIILEPILIDKNNLKQVIEDGIYTEDEIYKNQ